MKKLHLKLFAFIFIFLNLAVLQSMDNKAIVPAERSEYTLRASSVYGTYYDLLGVNKNATSDEIESSFKKLALKYHPDKNKSEEATSIMAVLNQAYSTLSDSKRRKEYDYVFTWQYKFKQDLIKKMRSKEFIIGVNISAYIFLCFLLNMALVVPSIVIDKKLVNKIKYKILNNQFDNSNEVLECINKAVENYCAENPELTQEQKDIAFQNALDNISIQILSNMSFKGKAKLLFEKTIVNKAETENS